MSEQSTPHPQTGMDRFFAALRGIGIRRRTDDKWIAGVCSGLADRLGIDPVIVRVALVVVALLGGAGITIYLVAWALLPNDRGEIAAQRALRDADGGSIVLLIFAAFAVFGGSAFAGPWWSGHSGWGFPWGLAFLGLLIWWLVKQSDNRPDADQRVMATRPGTPGAPGAPGAPGQWPTGAGPSPTGTLASPTAAGAWPIASGQAAPATGPVGPRTRVIPKAPGRRSGGPLMALLAIGLALATYGALIWAGNAFSWAGDHQTIAFAGALAAIGLLLVVVGVAGWKGGFATFLAVVLAITAWSSTVVPNGIQLGGRVGDATWKPTLVSSGTSYRLGVGNGVLDLSGLPTEGLSEAAVPAYVGLGELEVRVPEGLTVRVVGHVGLGEIHLPGELQNNNSTGQGGSNVTRTKVLGDGPVEVVVDAGVGIGQLTVVKE